MATAYDAPLRATHGDALSDAANATLDDLEELFLELDTSRGYLKTLWVQRELSELSRVMLYTGVHAILTAALAILGYRDIPGITVPQPLIVALLSATVAISLLPLSALLAYIGRVVLIAQRTAAFGPFVSRDEQQRIGGQVTRDSTNADD